MDTPLQYITNEHGETTAVIIPIEDWLGITNRLAEIPQENGDLPPWQKEILDERMKFMRENPDCFVPLDDFLKEMEEEANEEV
jgi:hypothetical protein